jgi:hypothetical protein
MDPAHAEEGAGKRDQRGRQYGKYILYINFHRFGIMPESERQSKQEDGPRPILPAVGLSPIIHEINYLDFRIIRPQEPKCLIGLELLQLKG